MKYYKIVTKFYNTQYIVLISIYQTQYVAYRKIPPSAPYAWRSSADKRHGLYARAASFTLDACALFTKSFGLAPKYVFAGYAVL